MRVPDKLESLNIIVQIESNDRKAIETIANGLISKVNQEFWKQGYSVEDAFSISSDNGFKGSFFISIKPQKANGDSVIDIHDKNLAKEYKVPTLESLSAEMIKAIKSRDGLLSAFVYRSDIPGLDFLENYIEKEDTKKYILK